MRLISAVLRPKPWRNPESPSNLVASVKMADDCHLGAM